MQVLLILSFTLLSFGSCTKPSNSTTWLEFGDMTTYQKLVDSRWIYHMENDLYIPGNTVYSDGKTLRSTDGTTSTLIVGSQYSSYSSFKDGVGSDAEFTTILSFTQLNRTHIVLADLYNHCLRLVDRVTQKTSTFAGKCGSENLGHYDGKDSKFAYPAFVTVDKRDENNLVVIDRNNNAIRSVNVTTAEVTTLIRSDKLDRPISLAWSTSYTETVYVSNKNHIAKLNLTDLTVSVLAGDPVKSGFKDGRLTQALFHQPRTILALNDDRILVADQDNSRLRLIDLESAVVTSVCTGVRGHEDGLSDECGIVYPHSLLLTPDNDILVGEVGGYIRRLEEEHKRNLLQYTARYSLDCLLLDNNITKDYMEMIAGRNMRLAGRLCVEDCRESTEFSPTTSCSNGTLSISWPTAPSLGRDVYTIPADVEQRLTQTLISRGSGIFYMLAKSESRAKLLYPNMNQNGAAVELSVLTTCANQRYYDEQAKQCV